MILCLVLAVPLTVVAEPPAKPTATQPSAAAPDTPLPRDPNNVYGQFDNDLSYVIRKHANPPDRVALYLHIKTGSLNETDAQNGIAHFIEHMSFNGSKHYAPGELIPLLNKMGMEFGQHTNAHTSYDETVYKLFMPDTKDETIETAMTILSDFAAGLLLTAEELDKERGVLLEEARSRKSAGERIQKAMMRSVFEGSRIAVHDVIGDEKQIAEWPKAQFDDYWNTWYRPENMTLIVVGDTDPEKIIAAAKKHLGEIKARAEGRKPLPAGIKPFDKPRAFVLTDPEQVMGMVRLMLIRPGRPAMKTYADYRLSEVENLGTWIVSRRLQQMVDKGTAAFRGAGLVISELYHEAILPSANAVGQPEDWNKMLDQVVMEINRAIEHGFTEQEFKLACKEALADAERAVERESTQDARVFVNRFSGAVGDGQPITSAAQRLDLMKKITSEATLADVHRIFVEHFKNKDYTYALIMPEKKEGLKLPNADDVLAAAAAAWALKTEAVAETKAADSILATLPEPGKIEKQTTDEDLKITTAKYANGVTIHHRFMDYKKDEILIRITIPGGDLEETAENHGVGEVASVVFDQPATSRLDSTQVRDLMTGKKVQVNGGVGLDAVTVAVSGSPSDIESGMQLVYAVLTDGKVEQAAFDNWKKQKLQQLEMLRKMPQGHLMRAMEEVIYAGDIRMARLTEEQVEKLDVKKGQAWLEHLVAGRPIEAAVVGDISLEDALKLTSRYLGSLPAKEPCLERLSGLRKLKRGPGPFAKTVQFESVTPKAMVMAGCTSCDDRETLDRRLFVMASRILSDRMIKKIREEERLVYGIGCDNQPGEAIPGLGMFTAVGVTDPEKSEKLAGMILDMLKDFADNGPTDEEVTTAKKQLANTLDTSLKEPGFWAGSLQELEYRGKPLAELKELPGVYQTFTAKQLQDVLKKYLKDDQIIRLVVNPDVKEDAAEKKPAADDESAEHKRKADPSEKKPADKATDKAGKDADDKKSDNGKGKSKDKGKNSSKNGGGNGDSNKDKDKNKDTSKDKRSGKKPAGAKQ
jgi:zinc protease